MHVIGYGFIMYLFKLLTLKLSFCNTIEHLYFFMIDIFHWVSLGYSCSNVS